MNRLLVLPALLIALAAAGADAPTAPPPATATTATMGADGVQRAAMTLDSYSYTPSHLVVEAGKPVELTLTSDSTFVPHNLVIDDPAFGKPLKQDVGSGKTVVLKFTPEHTGSFVFYCDKKIPFGSTHRAKGMEGTLEVRAGAAP